MNIDIRYRRNGICSLVVFSLFSFFWLSCFQGYLISFAYDKVISTIGGITGNCNRFIMAAFITAILDLLAVYLRRISKHDSVFSSIHFLVPSVILGLFTGFDDKNFFSQTPGQIVLTLVLTLSIWLIVAIIRHRNTIKPDRHMIVIATNLLVLFFEMLIVVSLGNTDENLHRRAAMERFIEKGQYEKALQVGYDEEETDSKIDWLRMEAMFALDEDSLGTGLAERLFKYPLSDISTVETFLRNSISSSEDSLTQSYLMNVLDMLDCNLHELENRIDLAQYNKVLPKYFMQALIMGGCDSLESYFPEQYQSEKKTFDEFEIRLNEFESEPVRIRRNAAYCDYHKTYYWFNAF